MAEALVTDVWFCKLTRLMDLNTEEIDALAALPFTLENVSSVRFLVNDGELVDHCCLLVAGYVVRHKTIRNGHRQIVSFHIPGDMVDLQHLLVPTADNNVQMITPGRVAWISIDALAKIAADFPRVAAAFAKDTLIDGSILREWLLNVGARDAKTKVAHILCEFVQRREALGISPVEAIELPFTQEQIGDATGLTSVHVNRMFRALADEGAIERIGRSLRIPDWSTFKSIADFDPAYLHQATRT